MEFVSENKSESELIYFENLANKIANLDIDIVPEKQTKLETLDKIEPGIKIGNVSEGFKLISPIFFTKVSELLESRKIPKSIEKFDKPIPREIFKRVLQEIKDVNNDFFNLRTVIVPDPDDDINTFYFTMIPNDGLYCHLPLIGRIIIPETYPTEPPVFHLLTRTNRYNVDVFYHNASTNNKSESSLCFDILKRKSQYGNLSTWEPSYTLSSVISALMQSIVSFNVPQMGGGEQQEFVTIESLEAGYTNVQDTINKYTKYIGDIPEIPANLAVECDAELLDFPKIIKVEPQTLKLKVEGGMFEFTVKSQRFKINEDTSFTCGFNLNNLTPNYVFSVVLTTNPEDLFGKKSHTILFRNGVTGSAAIKTTKTKDKTIWFYHGKPLNQTNLKLVITISNNQFVMAYQDITTKDKWVIHGDYPVAFLDKKSVGDISNKDFYLVLYFKRKNGSNSIEIDNIYPEKGLVLAK
jgi:ubiquitin-protein ligase